MSFSETIQFYQTFYRKSRQLCLYETVFEKKNYNIIQYVYGLLFPFIYTTGEIRGVNLKGQRILKF